MEDNLQAVAEETKESSQTSPETGGAREESLEDLLKEYDEAETQPEPKQEASTDIRETLDFLREEKERAIKERAKADVDKAVKVLKTELNDISISEDALRLMLNGAAGENPALRNAWARRGEDPGKFERVLKGLAGDFRSKFPKVDREVTEDREALAAAVRGASTSAPSDDFDEKSVKQMSDADFERYVQSMG